MARSNVDQEVHRLDALSRGRMLSAAESRVLEVMIKKQATYDRLRRNNAAGGSPSKDAPRAGSPTTNEGD